MTGIHLSLSLFPFTTSLFSTHLQLPQSPQQLCSNLAGQRLGQLHKAESVTVAEIMDNKLAYLDATVVDVSSDRCTVNVRVELSGSEVGGNEMAVQVSNRTLCVSLAFTTLTLLCFAFRDP